MNWIVGILLALLIVSAFRLSQRIVVTTSCINILEERRTFMREHTDELENVLKEVEYRTKEVQHVLKEGSK